MWEIVKKATAQTAVPPAGTEASKEWKDDQKKKNTPAQNKGLEPVKDVNSKQKQ